MSWISDRFHFFLPAKQETTQLNAYDRTQEIQTTAYGPPWPRCKGTPRKRPKSTRKCGPPARRRAHFHGRSRRFSYAPAYERERKWGLVQIEVAHFDLVVCPI